MFQAVIPTKLPAESLNLAGALPEQRNVEKEPAHNKTVNIWLVAGCNFAFVELPKIRQFTLQFTVQVFIKGDSNV